MELGHNIKAMRKARVLVPFLIILPIVAAADQGWKLEYSDPSMKIYSRHIADFRYKQFKLITEVEADIETVFRIFTDFDLYYRWFGYCKDSFLVKNHNPFKMTGFILIDSPWPVMDKYMVPDVYLDPSFQDGNARLRFELSVENHHIPPGKYEPVVQLKGECILERLPGDNTRITYINAMDVGGDLPAVFIERFRLDQVIQTSTKLSRYVKQR